MRSRSRWQVGQSTHTISGHLQFEMLRPFPFLSCPGRCAISKTRSSPHDSQHRGASGFVRKNLVWFESGSCFSFVRDLYQFSLSGFAEWNSRTLRLFLVLLHSSEQSLCWFASGFAKNCFLHSRHSLGFAVSFSEIAHLYAAPHFGEQYRLLECLVSYFDEQ